jgi:hypothetical protein
MNKLEGVVAALEVILDNVDYTRGACALTEMVGACLPVEAINQAREALRVAHESDPPDARDTD